MVRRYKPTEQQKEAAHDFYTNAQAAEAVKPDAPRSDLDLFFRKEAGLDERTDDEDLDGSLCDTYGSRTDVVKALRAAEHRPSRNATRALAEAHPYDYGMKSVEPALPLSHTSDFNGQLRGRETVLRFLRAGNATVTVVSKVSGTRFTYQFQRPKGWTPSPERPVAPTFCKVLTGADNNSDYEFVGTMWPEDGRWSDGAQVYRHSAKSRVGLSAPSVRALVWFLRTALHPDREEDLTRCEVWHEGRCGRCGRKLTVPSSVESGFGPECAGRM